MTINDFTFEERELIKTGKDSTLQEFRRQLVFDLEVSNDKDIIEFVTSVFNKFRLVTEREWEDMKKSFQDLI